MNRHNIILGFCLLTTFIRGIICAPSKSNIVGTEVCINDKYEKECHSVCLHEGSKNPGHCCEISLCIQCWNQRGEHLCGDQGRSKYNELQTERKAKFSGQGCTPKHNYNSNECKVFFRASTKTVKAESDSAKSTFIIMGVIAVILWIVVFVVYFMRKSKDKNDSTERYM